MGGPEQNLKCIGLKVDVGVWVRVEIQDLIA
jgi:hypothetical protein